MRLGHLEEQMNQSSLPMFENRNGPVKDFNIAGWIQKLERILDINCPGPWRT
jgi:protein TonB